MLHRLLTSKTYRILWQSIRNFAGGRHQKEIKALRKLNVNHRHRMILKALDLLYAKVIENPRLQKTIWYPIERVIFHKQFRGWTKPKTIIGAFIGSKERYLLKKEKNGVFFCINLKHPRYVAQRERAIQENPSLASSEDERFRLRDEKQTKQMDFRSKRSVPLFPGKSTDIYSQ